MKLDLREIRHFHLFCGLGGGAAGFNNGHARVGNMVAKFRCIGGIDVDPAGIRDFDRLSNSRGTVLDLFDREQFTAFHGREPGFGWREATTWDITRAAGNDRPHIVFLSAPCKGFSGLLAEKQSGTAKYQALNRLTLRGVFLTLEAFKDDPAELYIFENVPRIIRRGRKLLDRITALFRAYGYAVAETTHNCGEIGGLAQSRNRFLLVARHIAKVPTYLYEPPKLPLREGQLPRPNNFPTRRQAIRAAAADQLRQLRATRRSEHGTYRIKHDGQHFVDVCNWVRLTVHRETGHPCRPPRLATYTPPPPPPAPDLAADLPMFGGQLATA